jgi:hypothetical protein
LHQNYVSINKRTVLRKPLISALIAFSLFLVCVSSPILSVAAPLPEATAVPKMLGADSCSSSGCHGGGGKNQNQFLVWSLQDFHSQRPFATLTTARSKQIGEALQVVDPSTEKRCTSCHAPLREVPLPRRGESFRVSEGVSCESCHGPAENWLRSHTRSDWTHADRVHAGMRDLKSLYVRANTCVACHQRVELPLLKAGHPELIFELDGQCVSEPKHWREAPSRSGAQIWFVGQVVALREMSWQLSRETNSTEQLTARWSALLWLLQKLDGLDKSLPGLRDISSQPSTQNAVTILKTCDELAKRASELAWTEEMSRKALKTLSATSEDFQQEGTGGQTQARRAERLVLALDRLLLSAHSKAKAETELNRLFELAQSIPDFDARKFAAALRQFGKQIEKD